MALREKPHINTGGGTLFKVSLVYIVAQALFFAAAFAIATALQPMLSGGEGASPMPSNKLLIAAIGLVAFLIASLIAALPFMIAGSSYSRFESDYPNAECKLTVKMLLALLFALFVLPALLVSGKWQLAALFNASKEPALAIFAVVIPAAVYALGYWLASVGLPIGLRLGRKRFRTFAPEQAF